MRLVINPNGFVLLQLISGKLGDTNSDLENKVNGTNNFLGVYGECLGNRRR